MVEAGVDVFRLNFSHGSHEQHTAMLEMIRRIGVETGAQLAVLQDLCGPKIRLGEIPGGMVVCDQDAEFILAVEPDPRGNDPSPDLDLPRRWPTISSRARACSSPTARSPWTWSRRGRAGPGSRSRLPGHIRSNQGINVPGAGLSVAALTEKDLADLEWTAAHEVDYVGLSFVRKAEDIALLRERARTTGQPCPDRRQDREAAGRWTISTRSSPRPTP